MTIAIGVKCSDGILIAADMEHSYLWSHKTLGSKIMPGKCPAFGEFAVTGCGSSGYIYMAMDHIGRDFAAAAAKAKPADVLEEMILELREHAQRAAVGNDWSLELLIAVERGHAGSPELIHIDSDAAVHHVYQAHAMGTGSSIASSLFRVLRLENYSLAVAQYAVRYVLSATKESGFGCGGPSQLQSVPMAYEARDRFDDTEIADHVEGALRLVLVHARDKDLPDETFEEYLAQVVKAIRERRPASVAMRPAGRTSLT